jgi:hypothetical protein
MGLGFVLAAQWIAVKDKGLLIVCNHHDSIDGLPVSIAVSTMTILGLELGGDSSMVAGRARHDEQSCNYLIAEK